jgi:predicted TIM-barrel fold metal-dependent hydrolase
MSQHHATSPAAIRAKLGHPVIDADGHWLEFGPVVGDYLKKVGGERLTGAFRAFGDYVQHTLSLSADERRARRRAQEAWWAAPTKRTIDRATAMLPKLLHERLPELGIDFAVLYPTAGLGVPFIPNDEVRAPTCRAFNMFMAEFFGPYSDRMTPAAVIPMHTPDEAIAELEYAVKQLGLKVALMASMVRRRIPDAAERSPEDQRRLRWFDMIGLDSEYNYDPLWAKCLELGVSPTFHSGSRGVGLRISPTNFTYNHIGHFAAAGEAVCKAIFLGGVTRRFPTLKLAFLEGGVGWACGLYSDLIGHWKKRNEKALDDVDPRNLDRAMLADLFKRYGGDEMAGKLAQSRELNDFAAQMAHAPAQLDDFAACKIERAEDIRDLFVRNLYFGCEADDPLNAWAFKMRGNPFGAKLNTLFGSDIGHFDVPDMTHVLPEAYELVDDGLITGDDFREFVFANPVRFWGETNPEFFRGTAVETEARWLLSESRAAASASAAAAK